MLNVKVLFLELHIRNTLSGEKRLLTKLRKDLHDNMYNSGHLLYNERLQTKFQVFIIWKSI